MVNNGTNILMMNGGPVHQKSYEYKAQMKELGVTLGESSVMASTAQAEHHGFGSTRR